MEFKNTLWIVRFYQHIMPNGILKTNNAVRHDMLVVCNEHPRASKLHWSDIFN